MTTVAGAVNSCGSGMGLGLATCSTATSAILAGARQARRARYARIIGDRASEKKYFVFKLGTAKCQIDYFLRSYLLRRAGKCSIGKC